MTVESLTAQWDSLACPFALAPSAPHCTPCPLRRYVYLLMGVLIGSAVCPIAFCMVWSKCTSTGAISGALVGLVAAVCGWLGYTKANYGVVNLTTSGAAAHALQACG